MTNTTLNILPLEQMAVSDLAFDSQKDHQFHIAEPEKLSFHANAKAAIHILLQAFNIGREDEVYISTTSDSNYVSSCVTCTIFNYGKPSRVITENTRMIYVIDEFGFQDQRIYELRAKADEIGVPLVEDCAHTISSHFKDGKIETIADFVLFSMPKFMPVSEGGILYDGSNQFMVPNEERIEQIFNENYPIVSALKERKQEIFSYLKNQLGAPLDGFDLINSSVDPFLFVFDHTMKDEIYGAMAKALPKIILFPIHVKNRIGIPINPYADDVTYKIIVETIRNVIDA